MWWFDYYNSLLLVCIVWMFLFPVVVNLQVSLLCHTCQHFFIKFLRKFGKGSEDNLLSRVSQGQDPFERSKGGGRQSLFPKFFLRFLSWFLGVQKVWVIYSTEFITTWLTIFLQKKININLKYLPEKFEYSREFNSCPGSPVKGQHYWGSGRNPEHWHICCVINMSLIGLHCTRPLTNEKWSLF